MNAPAPALPTPDFSDWLSPILVKELRQGLKTKAFVSIFILVQVVMILLVGMQLLALANGGSRSTMQSFDGFFWAFVWIPLIVLMPARGLMTVSEEVKANTLDLVQLTRMSAFRIVLGKWVALVAQSGLLVAAILPYAVLRYFFGQVNVITDLVAIVLLLAFSFIMTAGTIALSSAPLVFRILALVVGVPGMFILGVSSLFARGVMGMSSGPITNNTGWDTFMLVVIVALYVYLLLEIAATRIAPLSENHAARKRVVALGMAVVGAALSWLIGEDSASGWVIACVPLWTWIVLEALCEHTVKLPSLYAPWVRRGPLARLAGRGLYPGWATGLVFTTLLCGLIVLAIYGINLRKGTGLNTSDAFELGMTCALVFSAIISPMPILLLFPRVRQPIWLYVLIQALFGLLFAIAAIVGDTPGVDKETAYAWLAPFPTSALFAFLEGGNNSTPLGTYAVVTLPVSAAIMVYLAIRVMSEFRVIRRLEDECRIKPEIAVPGVVTTPIEPSQALS
ncbi:MAG: hypothetical protein ACAI34_16570 [Verrucomicrobium sp.]